MTGGRHLASFSPLPAPGTPCLIPVCNCTPGGTILVTNGQFLTPNEPAAQYTAMQLSRLQTYHHAALAAMWIWALAMPQSLNPKLTAWKIQFVIHILSLLSIHVRLDDSLYLVEELLRQDTNEACVTVTVIFQSA